MQTSVDTSERTSRPSSDGVEGWMVLGYASRIHEMKQLLVV